MAHILIVDDEQSICWGLSKLVHSLGHTSAVAPSAEQAFLAARSQTPDAIVLDVRLPGIDGLSAMRQFREQCGPVPVIVITAYGDLATAVEAVRNGAFEYLVKPFELNVAQRAIQRALKTPDRSSPPVAEPPRPSSRREWSARRRRFKRCSSESRSSRRPRRASISAAKAAPARSSSPARSTSTATAATGRSCRSTWRR